MRAAPVAELAWGEEVWNVGRNGEWIVPTSPGGYQDRQPRTGFLVFDRVAAPPGASGSAVVAAVGVVGMLVVDSGRGDVAYALPMETVERQFREWGLPVGFSELSTATRSQQQHQQESQAILRARYERGAKICDQIADPNDASRPPDVPGTNLGARVIIGGLPPMEPIIEGCRLAAEGFPQVPRYRYQLGTSLFAVGRKGEAIEAWRAASNQGHAQATLLLQEVLNR